MPLKENDHVVLSRPLPEYGLRIGDIGAVVFVHCNSEAYKVEFVAGDGKTLGVVTLKPDLLIIDDMGMKQLPKRSGEYFFEIILRRHQVKSTLMTSNRPLEDWGKLIGDVPSASAILDRFLESAEIISFQGRSYRLRNRAADAPSKPSKVLTGKTRAKPDSTSGTSATT
jgi:hypothetical protein